MELQSEKENGRMSNMSLHCIGDSHTSFFTGYNMIQREYPCVGKSVVTKITTYRIGAPLAYNLCEKKSKSQSREKLFEIINKLDCKKDLILLSFGEIDCRAHLKKHAEKRDISLLEIVHECLQRYLIVIKEIQQKGFKVVVWNAIPTAMGLEDNLSEYPYYGNYLERNNLCILFNEELRKYSIEFNFFYLGTYEKIINKKLITNDKYYFDKVHLSSKLLPLVLKKVKNKFPCLKIKRSEFFKIKARYVCFILGIDKKIDRIITSIRRNNF